MKHSAYYGLLLLTLCLVGCGGGDDGPKTVTVSGQVTFASKPLADGEITFVAADGKGRSDAGRISAGQYSFESTLGPRKVEILSWQQIKGASEKLESGEEAFEARQIIPAKYNEETTLTADVTESGENEFDFPLEEK